MIVFYHGGCTDGFAAAYAAWLRYKDEATYVPMYYGSGQASAMKGLPLHQEIIMLDISLKVELLDNLVSTLQPKSITWIDHHSSSLDELGADKSKPVDFELSHNDAQIHVILNTQHSGCLLAWEYFHGSQLAPPMFFDIDDQDRYVNKREYARAFKFGLYHSKPWSFQQWSALQKNYSRIIDLGLQTIKFHDPMVARLAHQRVEVTLKDSEGRIHKGFAANCPNQMFTDVGHQLAVWSGTFGLVWNMNNQGRIVAQLRGIDAVNCGSIARHYGGGGHVNSSGFEMSPTQFLVLLGQA